MMEHAIVTVQRGEAGPARDVEVPVGVAADRLATLLARALDWEVDQSGYRTRFAIQVYPPGRMLGADETLASAGCWDGTWLVLHPVVREAPAPPTGVADPIAGWHAIGAGPTAPRSVPSPPSTAEPVLTWLPLEPPAADGPEEADSRTDGSDQAGPFSWKRLDP